MLCCVLLIDSDPRPPPIIYHGPQNQTLPTDGSAVLPCLASGEPAPSIIWLKGRLPLSTHDRRINVAESGSLEISSTTLQLYYLVHLLLSVKKKRWLFHNDMLFMKLRNLASA